MANEPTIRNADIVAFGQEPLDYRSSCLSINLLPENLSSQIAAKNLRSLGTPFIFIIINGVTERWSNNSEEVKKEEEIETKKLGSYIKANIEQLNPQTIVRKKSDFTSPPEHQFDMFVDSGLLIALEHEAATRIDTLIKRILNKIDNGFMSLQKEFNPRIVFEIVFRLLTAKLLKDRNIPTKPEIKVDSAENAFGAVLNYYSTKNNKGFDFPASILYDIWNEINLAISFKNLSVDTLTYIYENTFVSPSARKELGIHSTPSYIADYVLANIPLETSLKNIHFYDPTCGHGIFLIAAMRRIRSILPLTWSGKQRHNYFVRHIKGTEIDSFSVEVARMCLTLADFPESNGWDLYNQNVFDGKHLDKMASNSSIIIGNLPFQYTNLRGYERPKPALLLERIMRSQKENSIIGMVFPRAILDSVDYKIERKYLLSNYKLLSITNLPANTFLHSSSETSIIIAEKGNQSTNFYVNYFQVEDKDKKKFQSDFKIS